MQTGTPTFAIFVLTLSTVFTGGGCREEVQTSAEDLPVPSGTVQYGDHHVRRHGEAREGDYPVLAIDFPTYTFDNKTRTLSGFLIFEVDRSLIAVYGSGLSFSGDAGIGAARGLSGVYGLPYEVDDNPVIRNITPDGTAGIEYWNATVVLAANEAWQNISVYHDEEPGTGGKVIITKADTITNYGLLEISGIDTVASPSTPEERGNRVPNQTEGKSGGESGKSHLVKR